MNEWEIILWMVVFHVPAGGLACALTRLMRNNPVTVKVDGEE